MPRRTHLTIPDIYEHHGNDREILNSLCSWALSSILSIEQFKCSLISKHCPVITGELVRYSERDFILHLVKMDYLYIVLGWGQLSSDPAAEQLLLIYDLGCQLRWRGSCLKAVCNAEWSAWREGHGDKKKSTGALQEPGTGMGAPGHWASQCTRRASCISISPTHTASSPGVENVTCVHSVLKAAPGPFQDPFLQESSGILLLSSTSHPLCCCWIVASPLTRGFPSGRLVCTHQAVADPHHTAGGLFKKLSDSFGSNNSFQGDLEERKCDINLT